MKDLIDATTEDTIYAKHEFIKNLQKVIDKEVEETTALILKDIKKNSENKEFSEKNVEDWVFDYLWNCKDLVSFEEYVDSMNGQLV